MKKDATKRTVTPDADMFSEYEFSGGVRGKHYRAMQKGYTVTVHNKDGTKTVRHFGPGRTSIVLDKDVQKHYPDSESVNRQLRACIAQKIKPVGAKSETRRAVSKVTTSRSK